MDLPWLCTDTLAVATGSGCCSASCCHVSNPSSGCSLSIFRNTRCTFESSFPLGRLPLHAPTAGRVLKQPKVPSQRPFCPALTISPEEEVTQARWTCPKDHSHVEELQRGVPALPAPTAAHRVTQHLLLGGPTSSSPAATNLGPHWCLKFTAASAWPQVQFQLLYDAFHDTGTSGKARSKWKANKLANNRERGLLTRKIISFTGCCPYK